MENILNINMEKLNELNGGGIYNEIIYINDTKMEFKIIENEFKYTFELYYNNDLKLNENIYMENFEFKYNNENNKNISEVVYNNLYNKLTNNVNEYLNEIINNFDRIINDLIF